MPDLTITAAGGDTEEELRSLLRWLHADETLTRDVRGELGSSVPPAPGHMTGGLFDLLQLAIGSGLSAGALAVSLLQWRDSRRRAPLLTLRRGAVEVEIGAGADDETVRRIVALLGQEPGPAPEPGDDGRTT